MVWSTIKKAMASLSSSEFFQVHRSYVVAMSYVDKILDNHIHIGKHKIPIGASFKEAFIAEVNKFS